MKQSGIELVERKLAEPKKLKLMTHVVAGYPSLKDSEETVRMMAGEGADFIEIQVPFSDPLADGPVIMHANQVALENGTRFADVLAMIEKLAPLGVPLMLMTYANIPWKMGFDLFASRAVSNGAAGVILPDIPFDEDEGGFIETFNRHALACVYVVSPGTSPDRLAKVLPRLQGFLYTTLKTGTTGVHKSLASDSLGWLKQLRGLSNLKIAAGFGIASSDDLERLKGFADIAVIGSRMIKACDEGGLPEMKRLMRIFATSCAN